MKKENKLLIAYYFIAFIFGLFNIYTYFSYHKPLSESVFESANWWDLIVFLPAITLIILSIIVIILVRKKSIEKINLVYPIYYLTLLIFIVSLNFVLHKIYGFYEALSILDNLNKYFIIFYVFDVVFPVFMLNKIMEK